MGQKMMIITAYPADALEGCGGSILKYHEAGDEICLVVIGDGLEAHSAFTAEELRSDRAGCCLRLRRETEEIYRSLGVNCVCFLGEDSYPLNPGKETVKTLAGCIREQAPDFIVTHGAEKDFACLDHAAAAKAVIQAADAAFPGKTLPLFGMEPFRPELSGWHPDLMLDITDFEEQKEAALAALKTVAPDREFLIRRARARGVHSSGRGGKLSCRFAEAFSAFQPVCTQPYLIW